MASSENHEDNEASSSKHIIDYYKKFSQNRDLPRYFSGSPLSYLPEFKENVNEETSDVIVNAGVDIIITMVDEEQPAVEPEDASRASSVMSNRKLEWDNLADIGYDNLQKGKILKKSSSLPTLLTDLQQGKRDSSVKQLTKTSDLPKTHKSTSSSTNSNDKVKLIVLSYSSSSSAPVADLATSSSSSSPGAVKEEKPIYSSSSSNGKDNQPISISSSDSSGKQRISNFAYTLSYLKQKIGLPDAQSTPNTIEEKKKNNGITETPMLKKQEKPVKKVMSAIDEKPSTSKSSQIKNIEEHIEPLKIEKLAKKIINLCLTKPLSVECISDPPKSKGSITQAKTKKVNIAVQTDNISEKELVKIIAKCQENLNQSLIFMEHSDSDRNTCCTQTGSDIAVSNCESFEYIKNVNLNEKKEIETPENSPPKSEFVSNLKRSQKRDDLRMSSSEDNALPIENVVPTEVVSTNNFENGNDFENKIYLLQKLLKSKKYDNATKKRYIKKVIQKMTESKYLEESSNSSELFFPKKVTSTRKLEQAPVSTSSSSGSSKGILKKTVVEKSKISPRKKQLEIQTYTNEILIENSQKGRSNSDNKEHITSSSKCCETTSESSSAKSSSYQNWKDEKTISERIFEGRSLIRGGGDYLGNMVDKERENQINWISNEIDHLGKLKSLLEAHAKKDKKIEVEPKNIPKTTSVYVLSEGSDSEKCSRKKYVIETEVTAKFGGKRKFQIDGKQYTVGQLSDQEQITSRAVLRDIEVVSGDNTMNIKVTTFCETCKRSPCVCVTEFLDGVCNPFVCQNKMLAGGGMKENICKNCKETVCECAENVSSKKTICLLCHATPCLCKNGAVPKKCTVCNLQLCICPGSSQQPDYNGQFIPVTSEPPKSVDGAYSSRSSKSKSSSEYPVGCIVCGKWPCICEKVRKEDGKSSSSQEDLHLNIPIEINGNSLKKVFENCRCNIGKRCNCGFVDKLYKHFNIINQAKDSNYESKDCQTEVDENKYEYQNIAVQTQIDMEHKDMQTFKSEDTKMMQTEILTNYKSVGTQVEAKTVSENVQITPQAEEKYTEASDILKTKSELVQIGLNKTVRPKSAETQIDQANKRIGTDKILQENKKVQPFRPRSAEVQINMRSRKTSQETETNDIFLRDKIVQVPRPKSAEAQTYSRNVETVSSQADPIKEDAMTSTDIGKTVKFVTGFLDEEEIEIKSSSSSTSEQENAGVNVEICKCGFKKKSVRMGKDAEAQTNIRSCEKETERNKDAEAQVNMGGKRVVDKEIQTKIRNENLEKFGALEKKTRTRNAETQLHLKSSDSSGSSEFNTQEENKNAEVQVKMKSEEEKLRNEVKTDVTTGSISVDLSANEISTPTSYSRTTTTTSNTSSWTICTCCKQPISFDAISVLRQDNEEYPFCPRCIKKKPILTTVCYSGPGHTCTCCISDDVQAGPTSNQKVEEFCTCTKPSRHRHSQYCTHCQHKLRRTLKSKNGIAYTLTLEHESPNKLKRKKRKKQQLEEIKVKIPDPYSRKRHKDKVNLIKKDKETRNGQCSDSVGTGKTETCGQNVEQKPKKKSSLSLQEYLMYNRPDFIDSAEYRRQALLSTRLGREITKDEEKLKFLEENLQNDKVKKQTKLFSEKEMREITERNYKKLPEVQQKKIKHKEQRLKHADKLMVSVFAKKIQGCVLKGKSRFPIDSKVVNV